MAARIQLRPAVARAGEAVEVRILVGHPQENGLRRDAAGERIPRNLIKDLVLRYDGRIVFRADLGTGIAANPFLGIFIRATRTGEVVLTWVDEEDHGGGEKALLTVEG
jgi:sulfur-oxidizing protein SoxZ